MKKQTHDNHILLGTEAARTQKQISISLLAILLLPTIVALIMSIVGAQLSTILIVFMVIAAITIGIGIING